MRAIRAMSESMHLLYRIFSQAITLNTPLCVVQFLEILMRAKNHKHKLHSKSEQKMCGKKCYDKISEMK